MDNLLRKLKKNLDQFLNTDKNSRSAIIFGSIIGVFISCTPYFFYLYESVPQSQVWKTSLFTYNSQSWLDANYAMWILTGKLLPLIFLIIWFFTNRNWWFHSLLVPITMYIYQIIGFFSNETKFIDEFQLMYMVPVMALVIPSIYLLRARMLNRLNTQDKTMQEIEEEFMMKPTSLWGKVKQYF